MRIITTKTSRGFVLSRFTDRYSKGCTLQKSSLAGEDAVWLGLEHADAMVLVSEAKALGVVVPEGQETGWVRYPIPPEVAIPTRMHLTQEMVRSLLPYLTHFADFGELPDPDTFDEP